MKLITGTVNQYNFPAKIFCQYLLLKCRPEGKGLEGQKK